MGVPVGNLQKTFDDLNGFAKNNNDPFGLKFFKSAPFSVNDSFHVAVVTPVIHYTMGGLSIDGKARVLNAQSSQPIPGLYAAGEVTGGVHGKNRLGGSALLECVVYGREAGKSASEYVTAGGAQAAGGAASGVITISIPQANGNPITVTVSGGSSGGATSAALAGTPSVGAGLPRLAPHDSKVTTDGTTSHGGAPAAAPVAEEKKAAAVAPPTGANPNTEYTLAEVAKHNKDTDCWVVVGGQVIDATSFLSDHPGGKMAIMAFAGRDATEEFNMVHEEGVLQKFASNLIVGKLKATAKL